MSDVNSVDNFQRAFVMASVKNPNGVTYSHIFKAMEEGRSGFASGDFVREQIQAGINKEDIGVAYGVLDQDGNVEMAFSGLGNEPEEAKGRIVEPVFL